LELAYATGLRASELVRLTLEEVDLEEDLVRCFGKRSRERIAPFGANAKRALVRYLEAARPAFLRNRGERTVFLTRLGRGFTRMGYWKLLEGYRKAAGIERPISPHTLRHSCATHLLEGGVVRHTGALALGHDDAAAARARLPADDAGSAPSAEGNDQPGRTAGLWIRAGLLGAERSLRQRAGVRVPVPVHAEPPRGAG